jgi:hypothetical protein
MTMLEELGPHRGYYPEPSKSILISKPDQQDRARQALAGFDFRYVDGHRDVGGFIGTDEARAAWLEPMLNDWVHGIEKLSMVAQRFPQTAYAGLSKSLQMEWQYLQRVLPSSGPAFAQIETALAETFLPALLQEPAAPTPPFRNLLALPVRKAGLGVPDPRQTGADCHTASLACTEELTRTLRAGTNLDVQAHANHASKQRRRLKKIKDEEQETLLQDLCTGTRPAAARRMTRSKETGARLTAMPTTLNGTELSEEEFRDNLRLQFGLSPLSSRHCATAATRNSRLSTPYRAKREALFCSATTMWPQNGTSCVLLPSPPLPSPTNL